MKTLWVMAAILAAGLSTTALADQGAANQCSSNAAQQLQSRLGKASGPTEKQVCKEAARREKDKCKGTGTSPAAPK
jgi:hypothetical protein